MNILAVSNFCTQTKDIWHIVGVVMGIFCIVVPLLIIIFGSIDLGKAVVASKDDEIKKAMKQLGMRAIAGIAILLVPTIVGAIFNLVGATGEGDYEVCASCIADHGCK